MMVGAFKRAIARHIFMEIRVPIQDRLKLHREYWALLPKDEADKLRAEFARQQREENEHRRALEIVEAGRPRNFRGK